MGQVILAVVAWATLAALRFFSLRVESTTSFATDILRLVWVIAIVLTITATVTVARRLGFVAALPLVLLSVLAAVTIAVVDWRSAYVHDHYRRHRLEFATLASTIGGARKSERVDLPLPGDLADLSVDGKVTWIYGMNGQYVAFLPQRLGPRTVGYAFFGQAVPGDSVWSCLASACLPHWDLGDGWFWMDGEVG